MTTKDKIFNYFLGNSDLRILFIFDSMDFISSEIADVKWPDNYVYHKFDGRYFYIPAYQRGYRWSEKQVGDLLRDLLCFANDKKEDFDFYCLQPVIANAFEKPFTTIVRSAIPGSAAADTNSVLYTKYSYTSSEMQ